MNNFYDTTEYVKYLEALDKMKHSKNRFHKVFTPHRFFMDVKLADCDPCTFCDNTKHEHRGSSIEDEKIDPEKCKGCLNHMRWVYYALTKLSYYENAIPVIENKPVDDSKKCMFCNTPGGRLVKLPSGTEGILCNDCLDEMFNHYQK